MGSSGINQAAQSQTPQQGAQDSSHQKQIEQLKAKLTAKSSAEAGWEAEKSALKERIASLEQVKSENEKHKETIRKLKAQAAQSQTPQQRAQDSSHQNEIKELKAQLVAKTSAAQVAWEDKKSELVGRIASLQEEVES